jgi:hypothetical protein
VNDESVKIGKQLLILNKLGDLGESREHE